MGFGLARPVAGMGIARGWRALGAALAAAGLLLTAHGGAAQESVACFTPEERLRLVAFWNTAGRYRVAPPPDARQLGTWQIRLTPDGSRWLLAYQRALGLGRLPPTTDAGMVAHPRPDWETWVQAKISYDRWQAQRAADEANAPQGIAPRAGEPPPHPGAIPLELLAAAGNPPPFAAAVTPLRHTITFEDGEAFDYPDNIMLRARYAYYRFPQGTVALGTRLKDMPAQELEALFRAAGFSESEQRVAAAVSKLEGGFETVNTYDTGYVSIGFIQFVTLATGKESLSEVLLRQKTDRPDDFQRDFRAYGLDVKPNQEIVCVDPSTGAELAGSAAVMRIIEDKRLTAVFQRAGRRSTAFRVAQIQVARSHYWPMDDPLKITVGGRELIGKVSDVIQSEAGAATLFDRKVNRGTLAPFAQVLAALMEEKGLSSLEQAREYERDLIAALKYRVDFLADTGLGQPKPPPSR